MQLSAVVFDCKCLKLSMFSWHPGQVIFDVLGQTDIQGVHDITQSLVEGLKSLGDQKNVCVVFLLCLLCM